MADPDTDPSPKDATPPPLDTHAPQLTTEIPDFLGDKASDGMDGVLRQLPEMTAKIGKLSGADDTAKALAGDAARYRARADQPKPDQVADPNLGKMPTRPDTTLKDSTQAFQNDATVLSIFGSLLTRAPLTSAMNAAAGAMNGYRQGNLDQAKQYEKKFHDDLASAIEQNKTEMEKYTAALNKRNSTMQDRAADLEAIAAETKNDQLLGLVKAGKFDDAVKILQMNAAAAARMQQQTFMNQWREEGIAERRRHDVATEQARNTGITTAQARQNVMIDEAQEQVEKWQNDPKTAARMKQALTSPLPNAEDKQFIDTVKTARQAKYEPRPGAGGGGGPGGGAGAAGLVAHAKEAVDQGMPRDQVRQMFIGMGGSADEFDRAIPVKGGPRASPPTAVPPAAPTAQPSAPTMSAIDQWRLNQEAPPGRSTGPITLPQQ